MADSGRGPELPVKASFCPCKESRRARLVVTGTCAKLSCKEGECEDLTGGSGGSRSPEIWRSPHSLLARRKQWLGCLCHGL